MPVYFTSLNSGSNGNCYYIGNETEAVLIDAGISCRETEKRMRKLGLSMDIVKAIFISHEHTDHIKGADGIAKKYAIPVYITAGTLHRCDKIIPQQHTVPFITNAPVQIGELRVTGFPKHHDAGDPHSFVIECSEIRVGVFTDIGKPCDHVTRHFGRCHAAFLEANYDEDMLENGSYPIYLKNRIRGGNGHLSNRQALDLFVKYRPDYMTHVLLSHLSKENNHPGTVQQMFEAVATGTSVIIASRYEETALYSIQPAVKKINYKKTASIRLMQLSLFE